MDIFQFKLKIITYFIDIVTMHQIFNMTTWGNVNFWQSVGNNEDKKGGKTKTENWRDQLGLHNPTCKIWEVWGNIQVNPN